MTLQRSVRASWDGDPGVAARAIPLVTTPLSWLWRAVTSWRNRRWDRRPPEAIPGLRVVSVGNLAVGGTGKTPMSRWMVAHFRERGVRCALVLSGYGEDEVLLHRRWHPDVPVLSGRDRRALLQEARDAGARVAVMDDAFQHRRAPRDLDIVLLRAEHRFPGHVLPRGRYREPPSALRRAHLVIVTRKSVGPEAAHALAERAYPYTGAPVGAGAALVPEAWLDLHGEEACAPMGRLLAVASVADPESFLHTVRAARPGTEVALRGFPDHHEYTEEDVRSLLAESNGRTIVTTEKDAVKLARLDLVPDSTRVLAAGIAWDWGEEVVRAALDRLVGGDA